jgi:hypothetical protein
VVTDLYGHKGDCFTDSEITLEKLKDHLRPYLKGTKQAKPMAQSGLIKLDKVQYQRGL